MNIRTRFQIFTKNFNSIKATQATINEIWENEKIKLIDKIDICIRNGLYNKLQDVPDDQLKTILQQYTYMPSYNHYVRIVSIMYGKKDYSFLPAMIDFAIRSHQKDIFMFVNTAFALAPLPSIAFVFQVAKYQNTNQLKYNMNCLQAIKNILEFKPELFIAVIKDNHEIKEDFIRLIKNDRLSTNLCQVIANNPILENFFCEEHPELFMDIIYDINKTSKAKISELYSLSEPKIVRHLKGENRFSAAYYFDRDFDKEEEHQQYIASLQSLFKLEVDEAEYIARRDIDYFFKEFLLRTQEKKPGYIKRVIELEKKYQITNITPFLLRYNDSTLVEELMAIDITTLTREEQQELINKLHNLLAKPRLNALDNIETLRIKTIQELEKDGYSTTRGIKKGISNPKALGKADNAFGVYQKVIKVYPDGHIRFEEGQTEYGHLSMLKSVNDDEPELNESGVEGKIMYAMALKGYCIFINEANVVRLVMPNIDDLTIEQIKTIKGIIQDIKISEPEFNYGFVIEDGVIDEIDGVSKEVILEVLDTIYNQKIGYNNSQAAI